MDPFAPLENRAWFEGILVESLVTHKLNLSVSNADSVVELLSSAFCLHPSHHRHGAVIPCRLVGKVIFHRKVCQLNSY